MRPLVSILIPVYNAEPWLAETLQCAVEQTWPNTEIIVVDDGSTDNSLQIAKQCESSSVKVITQQNQGGCAARNRALGEAHGDFIQYLDADDLMELDKIEVQIKRLAKEPSGTIATTRWSRFYEEPGDYTGRPSGVDWKDFSPPIKWLIVAANKKTMFPPHSWLTPRKVIARSGRWDESLVANQDGEYFARVVLASTKIVHCSQTEVYYRFSGEGSVTATRTVPKLTSRFDAAHKIADYMLDMEDSSRTRQAAANLLKRIVYRAYPRLPKEIARAEKRIDDLGGATIRPCGRPLYQGAINLVGWKTAKRVRRIYYKIRYGISI